MTRDEIISFYETAHHPFRPYRLVLRTGESIEFRFPMSMGVGKDFVAAAPDRKRVRHIPFQVVDRLELIEAEVRS